MFDPETLIPEARSTFGGRVYQRQDYTTNTVFDNISRDFTGIGATYTLSVGGANTTGIETGSGVLFLMIYSKHQLLLIMQETSTILLKVQQELQV